MREIKVFVGIGLDDEGIKNALTSEDEPGVANTSLYEFAHALLEHTDDRANIDDVTVERVTINKDYPNQVEIEFETYWSAYYGCRDMNRSDTESECESATYTSDGYLIFLAPTVRRPSNDC